MTFEHDFDATPPGRDEPYVQIRVRGAVSLTGPFVLFETIDLDPIDDDPFNPASHRVEPALVPFETGYLTIAWVDANGQETPQSEPFRSPALHGPIGLPTIADLRAYLDGQVDDDDDPFLTKALNGAVSFADWYAGGLPDPLPEYAVDMLLALAARRFYERNSGYRDALVGPDGGLTYFKSLPSSVKDVLDGMRGPLIY